MFLRTSVAAVAVALALTFCAIAQTTAPTDNSYVGRVTGTNVYVRSGPGPSFYECVKLSSPAMVKVLGEQDGWLMIAPPRECHSLVAKQFVQAAGNVGKVTGNRVLVRAGSDLQPARMGQVQGHFGTGDRVTILGENGDYYKIIPPAGAAFWISGQFVAPVSGAGGETPTVATSGPTTTAPVLVTTTRPIETISQELAEWKAAEGALKEEFDTPREQRDLAGLLERYKSIKIAPDSPLADYVEARVRYLQSEIDLLDDLRRVAQLVEDVNTTQAKLDADKNRISIAVTPPTQQTYAAEGILSPSGLFPGGATGPKRYIVTDEARRIIYSYVQCTTGAVDLSAHVGQYVGVIGSASYDEKLRMYVVEAEQIVVLRQGEPAVPSEPAPPAPAPEPVAPTTPEPVEPVTPEPAEPTTPEPAEPATTAPVEPAPLPETGLPIVEPDSAPTTTAPVNPQEYE